MAIMGGWWCHLLRQGILKAKQAKKEDDKFKFGDVEFSMTNRHPKITKWSSLGQLDL